MWWVYIVECSDNTFYTGITNDLARRINQHNINKGAKYTRGRNPVTLLVSIVYENKSLAAKEEYRIKRLTKKEKLRLIYKLNIFNNS